MSTIWPKYFMKNILKAPPSYDFAVIHLLTFKTLQHCQLAGRRRAVRRPIRLTYFTRLFMLYYMPIILIEQQLDISLIYLIYNSEIVTRRQTQHDLKVDQGCPSAIFCLLSQIVQTEFSNWSSIRPSMTTQYYPQSIYPVYPVIISCKENTQKKAIRFFSYRTDVLFLQNKKRPQTGVSFRSHTRSHVIIIITIYIMFVKLFFMFCTATWTSCGWIIISWRSLSLSILPAWAIRISRACVIFWT